jgi:hypothetical protein
VIEPPSVGVKGVAKKVIAGVSRMLGWGDQIEAVYRKR